MVRAHAMAASVQGARWRVTVWQPGRKATSVQPSLYWARFWAAEVTGDLTFRDPVHWDPVGFRIMAGTGCPDVRAHYGS